MERNCQNCDHVGTRRLVMADGSVNELEGALVCRRYPPVFFTEYTFDQPRSTAGWPNVVASDRCGEFTPKQ